MNVKSKSLSELIKYGVVGTANNVIAYLFFLVLTYTGMEPKLTMTLIYVVCAAIGYVSHKKWTFTHDGNILSSSARYVIAHVFGYLINLLLLYAFFNILGFPYQWVQAASILIVAMFLFVAFKFFVFTQPNAIESNR